MGKVSILKTEKDLKNTLIKSLDNIGGLSRYLKPDEKVLIKPNINGTEAVTSIAVVDSVIEYLKDCGVRNITIAESTFGDSNMTDLCFKKTGYLELSARHRIPILNLNKSRLVKVVVKNPLVTNELAIAEEVFEAGLIINIPVMKVHYATAITLSLKNLKGLLVGNEKRRFHEIGLDKAIVDLNNTIGPTLNLIDGTVCMERMGPRGGDLVELNILLAGWDRGEVDSVGAAVMGFKISEVKHLQLYLENRNMKIEDIITVGDTISEVGHDFVKAHLNHPIPDTFHVHDTDACSSCMNAFLLSCQILGSDCRFDADIYLGETRSLEGGTGGKKIGFGNCCAKRGLLFDETVVGCPPYPFALKKIVEQRNT